MSGCVVSNKLVWNRLLFCLSMFFLAATLMSVPAAKAQDEPSFEGATVANQMFSAGVAIEALELPVASGGNGDLTYDLRPLPPGLEFDAASRTLSGTPSDVVVFPEKVFYSMTYEVTDANGATAILTFNISVEEEDVAPNFEGATVANQMFSAGVAIEALELPVASGGNGDLTYDLRPLPPGLEFDAASRTLSGTPSEVAIFSMTYEVTDADGDAATLIFEIEIDTKPSFNGSVADQQYETGKAIGTLQLPDATVGEREEPPVYSLDGLNAQGEPEMPPGLTFDDQALTLSGTPTKSGTYTLTYRVVDSDTNMEDSDETTLNFTVDVQLTFAEAFENQTFSEGDNIELMLPAALATDNRLEYSLSGEPEIPPDLAFDAGPASRTLSGELPTDLLADNLYAESYALTYIVKVAGDDNPLNKAELGFTIVVDGMPSFGDKTALVPADPYPAGAAMSLTLPEAFSGNVELTYSLELPPDLSDLTFDPATRTLSGTPRTDRVYAADYDLTLVVEDAGGDVGGDVAELDFTIGVDGEPSFEGVTAGAEPSYPAGAEMSLTLPEPIGGNVMWEYRLKGELPPGLEFNDDPAIREISGTPPRNVLYDAEYPLILEVWDGGGDVVGGDVDELDFTIVVDGEPDFGDDKTVDAEPSYPAGAEMSLTLPDADGGNVELTYSVTLPDDLEQRKALSFLKFDPATRTLSGTPSAYRMYDAEYTLTLVVKDADEDEDTLDFTIVVNGKPIFRQEVPPQRYIADGEEKSLRLPKAVGGNVALTYHLEEDLPPGLVFNDDPTSPKIEGTLLVDSFYGDERDGYTLTYWSTDVDGDESDPLHFTIRVNGQPRFKSDVDVPAEPYPAGAAIAPLVLPEAEGGNVALEYRLNEEALPPGLVFDAASRTISGTPPKYASYAYEGYTLTYRVNDADELTDEPAPLEFTFWVNGQPRFDEGVSEQITFAEGQTIDPFVLPSASGGNGQLTYELVGTLPEGLSYDGASRTISGTLGADELYDQAEAEGYALTYRVTDQDGDAPADPDPAALTFTIVVHGMPSFGDQVVEDQLYTAGEDVSLGLPEAVGGNGALTYSLNEADLPPGLAFDGSARTISGELPVEATYAESYALRYQVADVDGDVMTLRFTIAVDGIPSFVSVQDDPSYAAGAAIAPLVLPEAVGGNVDRTYRLDGVLPDGLSFDAASRTISGTPPKYVSYAFEGYALTYRVKDVDDQEPAPLEFTLWVNGQPRFDEGVSEQITFAEGQTIDPFVLPSASGGNGQLTYELVGTLPEGLSYDGASRTISGTLGADELYDQAEAEGYALTYRVTDQDGDAPADPDPAALTFTIVVHGMPSFGDQVVEDQLYTAGEDVSLGLPEAVGGNGALTYSLNEADLPPGLAFDGSARTISGELPIEATYAESYALRYQVADVDGDVMTLRFTIAVDGIPSFVSVQDDPSYAAGAAIAPLVLPEAVGGNVDRTYRLDGVLPDGLSFDAASRTISGTPPKYVSYAFEGYALTYRVKDVDDQEPAPLEFTLWVNGQPRFDEGVSEQITFAEGQTIDPFVLPSASGGNGQLTYELVGTLPEGLSYDGASRTISGTLGADELYDQAEAEGYALTYRVTDQDGDAPADPDPAALTFTIVVHGMPSFGDQVVEDQLYTAGEDVSLGLPEAVGGNGALTYSLNEADLPPGLAFDGSARTISGELPVEATYAESYALRYQVADVDGDVMTLRFTIAVDGIPSFVSAQDDPSYAAGAAIAPLVLPEAVGGNVDRTYRLDGVLPDGLSFDAASRTISGTPPKYASYAFEGYALTYRVKDVDDQEPAPLEFTFWVNGQPRFDEGVSEQITFAEGQTIDPFVLPSASGGNGQLTYELVGTLPEGLSYDGASRTISGTLGADELYDQAEAEGYALTYRVTDQDGDAPADPDPAALTFTIVVHGMPSFGDQVVEDQLYTAGEDVSLGLPEAVGGNGALTYSLNEADLPPGLAFDGSARTISGELPVEATYAESYALRYQVADVDGDVMTLRFTIAVDGIPSFVSAQDDPSYAAGAAIAPLVLPEAVGGNVDRTYRLDGVLPDGLSFDAASRTISGTPPKYASYAFEGYALTYRVKDVDDQEPAPLEFTLWVNGQPRFDEGVSEQITFAEGQTIDPFVLPSASGGNGQLTYELVGTLPEGLSYDGASRTISGTLGADELYDQAEAEGYALTYRVTDQDGDAPADPDPAALTFTIVVHGMPSFGDQVVEDQLYTAGEDVSLGLPEAVGGNGALTYSLNEADLPPGLAFDGSARTISGTPPADYLYVAEGYALTYQVADVDGDAVTLRFTIAVNGIPSFGDQVVEDQQYTVGDAVSLELPEAVGGNVALTYFLDGELPPGLAFNPTSRTISGELSPNVSYSPEGYALTYRVADVDDEEAAPLTFTIAVNGMPFFEGTITNQRVPEGEEMAPLELPAALGGNGELTYSLNEENLPPGLAFDPVARTISGTPELNVSHPAEGYALTYRVEDEDGDSAELSFFLTVDGTPTFFDATIEDRILRQNEAMDPWEFPAAAGGNGDLTYSLDMNVPGLSFDAAARTLSGTPTHTGVYRLVYQVEDIDGDSAELTFHITVDGAPSFSGDVANQTYIAGEAIEDLVLPLASGGNLLSLNPDGEVVFGELTYTLDNVPPGLTFDPNPMSPMLSGTPAEVGTYTLTYTAHDSDDNMTAEDAAILSFEVRVEESATDRFAELNEQILSKYALAIADGTNRAIENRLEHMDRAGDENRSFRFAAESTLHDMIQSGRIFENRPVNMSQVANGSSFAVPFGFGRGCILCPGSPTFWGRGDYGQMSSDDGSLDWEGNLSRAQIGLDARPGAEMLTGLALSWAQGSFDYTAPLLGEERVDGTYETRMLSLHPYVGFSPGRLGVWLTAGLGRGNLDIDDEQGTIGQQSSDTSLRTASVGASGDLLASGPTQVRVKAAATVAQVEVEGGALNVAEGGNRIAEQTVSANRLRLALKASHAYEAGMDGQVTPQLEVALRQDGGDGLTGAGVEVGGGLRYEGGGFTLEAMARSLVSDGDDAVEYKEWGAHLLLQRSAGTGGRGLSLRVMPTYGTQANSLTLWERSVAEIADRGVANAEGQLRAEVGYGLAALGGRGVYTVYSGMTQAPERMQFRLGTRFEVDSSMSVSLESARWQRMAGAADHGLLLRGRLVF